MEYTSPPSVTAGVTTVSATVNNAYKTAIDQIGLTGLYPAQRQGGSATAWNTVGTTNYDAPQNTKIQVGIVRYAGSTVTVTFPEVFSQIPLVFFGTFQNYGGAGAWPILYLNSVSVSNFAFNGIVVIGSGGYGIDVPWFAIGPA
jgi:hypothetical protein